MKTHLAKSATVTLLKIIQEFTEKTRMGIRKDVSDAKVAIH